MKKDKSYTLNDDGSADIYIYHPSVKEPDIFRLGPEQVDTLFAHADYVIKHRICAGRIDALMSILEHIVAHHGPKTRYEAILRERTLTEESK